MRQAGILAAAGIVALNSMVDRLAEDHQNARHLATGLAQLPGIAIDPTSVPTNLVIFEMAPAAMSPADFALALNHRGIKLSPIGGQRLRAVTHYGIQAQDVDRALDAAREILSA